MTVIAEPAVLDIEQFLAYHADIARPLDPDQEAAVRLPAADGVLMVAGPGTGKTQGLAARVLKLVMVDGLPPDSVLATTFTEKAAAELRSRILGRGFALIDRASEDASVLEAQAERLTRTDLNQIRTGTLDSVAEAILRDFRPGGDAAPQVLDDFAAKTVMLEAGLFDGRRFEDPDLDDWLLRISGRDSTYGWNVGSKNELLVTLRDRVNHDLVDLNSYAGAPGGGTGRIRFREALDAYKSQLAERGFVDFAGLESRLLERLADGSLGDFTRRLRAVLVDEYQDTNALQEAIYFALASAAGGALTVVGDDDQSLYRFRGATVELFSGFEDRYQATFGPRPHKRFLTRSYRSTPIITSLVEGFITLDPAFLPARVAGKPPLQPTRSPEGAAPILGMFRPDKPTLAHDLAAFIGAVCSSAGYALPDGQVVAVAADGGAVGDLAFLAASPREYNSANQPRLPSFLRGELRRLDPSIEMFNPRGEDFTRIPVVAALGGLVLRCLDPDGTLTGTMRGLGQSDRQTLNNWRAAAAALPADRDRDRYVANWANRAGQRWPDAVNVLELLYGLRHYLPELFEAEGQVHFEVFARQAQVLARIGRYRGRIVLTRDDRSTTEALRRFVVPIATGAVDIDEDLIEAFPRDQLNVLSIHQAKGLEFPLTIVDIGSDFRGDYVAQRRARFPERPGADHIAEDEFAPFAAVPARGRTGLDRAFDDLIRKFFVAFSRAEDVLLLVGMDAAAPTGRLPNVAAGYRRDRAAVWDAPRPYVEI